MRKRKVELGMAMGIIVDLHLRKLKGKEIIEYSICKLGFLVCCDF